MELIWPQGPFPKATLAPCAIRRCVVQDRNRFPSWTLRFLHTPEAIHALCPPRHPKSAVPCGPPSCLGVRIMRPWRGVSDNFRQEIFFRFLFPTVCTRKPLELFGRGWKLSYKFDTPVIPETPEALSGTQELEARSRL